MLAISFGVVVGILIGWNLPQPQYAKDLQAKIVAKIKSKFEKKED